MPREQLKPGEHGKFSFAPTPDGQVRARARVCLLDNSVVQVTRIGKNEATALSKLQKAIAERLGAASGSSELAPNSKVGLACRQWIDELRERSRWPNPPSHEQRQHLKVVEHRGESGWVVDGGRGDDPDELWPLPGVGKCLNPACLVDTVLRSCLHEHRRTDARVFGVGGKVTLRHRRFLVEPRIPPQPCVPHVAVGVDDARHGDHRVAQ